MSTDRSFADFVVDQLELAGEISCKKMFGEYALYCDGKVVALLCDNQLYVKPTHEGRSHIGTPNEAPPFPGARNWFLISEELDSPRRLSTLIRLTANALPLPAPRGAKRKSGTRR